MSSIYIISYDFLLIFILCNAEVAEISSDKEQRSYGLLMMERLTGSEEGRVDHVLQVRICIIFMPLYEFVLVCRLLYIFFGYMAQLVSIFCVLFSY